MADVIFDLGNTLEVLYPNVPKENFRKFCPPAAGQGQGANTGYVPHKLVTNLEGQT